MKRFGKAIICLLLVACMLAQLVPASFAADKAEPVQLPGQNGITTTVRLPSKGDKFTDVAKNSWYYDAVCYVTDNGIFAGVSDTLFDPSGTMTRAMVVSVLARMAGIDPDDYTQPTGFSDVKSGSWYEASVAWAVKYSVTSGTGNGKFSPNRAVTRQELATLFVNYFTIFGVSLGDDDLIGSEPSDIDTCADWAKDAVLVLWQRGLMVGDGSGAFDPLRVITRAECAVLCMQIHKIVEEWKDAPNDSPWKPAKPGAEGSYTVTFLDGEGGYITAMTAQNGLGLGADRVPFFSDPDPEGGVLFRGWFFRDETDPDVPLRLFNALYPYNEDLTVYAICATQEQMHAYLEDEYYVIEGKVGTTYSFLIRPLNGAEFNPDYDLAIYTDDFNSRMDYTVEPQENGDILITVENLKPGAYYTAVITRDFVFVMPENDSEDAQLLPMTEDVRYIEFAVEKPVHAQIQYREDVRWLPASEVQLADMAGADALGVERETDDTTTPLGQGAFTYTPKRGDTGFTVGTVVCVYNDDTVRLKDADGNPIEVRRLAPNVRDYDEAAYEGLGYSYADLYASGTEAFYTVTAVTPQEDGSVTCTFREMDSSELDQILFVPDMIPYLVAKLPENTEGTVGTIKNYAAYDTELYVSYRGDKVPAPVVGDFVTLFTQELRNYSDTSLDKMREGTYPGKEPFVYAQITAVDGMQLTYEVTTREKLLEAMEYADKYYVERYVPDNLQPKFTEEELQQFADETGELFDEQAIRAFVTKAIDEDTGLDSQTAEDAKALLDHNEISYDADDPTLRGGHNADDSKKVEVTGKDFYVSFDDSHLSYIPNTNGRIKAAVNIGGIMIVKLRLREGINLYYVISINFTQEVCAGLSASGSYEIGWKLVVPYLKALKLSLSATFDTATDVTLDIRHYTVDKSHMGCMYLYGRQADAQEHWENFQDFLLSKAFVCHGAALYSKEAEFFSLAADADAIDESNVIEREEAERKARYKADEINKMWTNKEFGLDEAWNLYYKQGGSPELSAAETAAADKAMEGAKQQVVSNLSGVTSRFPFIGTLVDKALGDANKNLEDAGTELADLNPDGTATEEWKKAQEQIEAAKAEEKKLEEKNAEQAEKEKESAKNFSKDLDTYLNYAESSLKYIWSMTVSARLTVESVYKQLSANPDYDSDTLAELQNVIENLQKSENLAMLLRRFVQAFKQLAIVAKSAVNLAKNNYDGGIGMLSEIYQIITSVHGALKDVKVILAQLQKDWFEEGSDEYNHCQTGIDVILDITEWSEVVMDLLGEVAVILELDTGKYGYSKTDGVSEVDTSSNYWDFRLMREDDFLEFSLNTEVLEKLGRGDEEMSEDSMQVLAEKYSEMCNITNTWMDLYRKNFINQDIPIFAGLDVTFCTDFVAQINVNVALNFNFHVDYGVEYRVTIDVLSGEKDLKVLDRSNQMLSVSMLTMGTLGFRVGLEATIGLKIIKIFTVNVVVELMPYINLHAYALFQYKRDFFNDTSDLKYMGAMYIDVGFHIGFWLTLKFDILIYKNTWKWNLWNKDITLLDLGERENVYNFSYPQPSKDSLSGRSSELAAAINGTPEEKSEVNTDPEGILIVNPASGYRIPKQAMMMSYMDMTDGALGKSAFEADHYRYTFFTVPTERDTTEYPHEGNLPVDYEMDEVVLTDKDGNIIYQENNGAGLPVTVNFDLDFSDYEENITLVTNEGTPVTQWVETDRSYIDDEGIKRGEYVLDDRFTVNNDGVITFLPSTQDDRIYAQDVYVLMEWMPAKLQFTSYPIRRVVHILWTNEEPVSFLNAEVRLVEEDRMTDEEKSYTVWSDTFVRGCEFVRIPSLTQVIDSFDPGALIYDRSETGYAGSMSKEGAYVERPQENIIQYISAKRKEYSLDICGLDANGNDITKTVTAEYGYSFPIDDVTLPEKVTTTDDAGNPKYLRLSGFLPLQNKDGIEQIWTGVWDKLDSEESGWSYPIDQQMAKDLSDEYIPRYLRACYDDETVKAVFTFVGIDHESITQYLRRGEAPDLSAANAQIAALQAKAKAEGKTLNVTWDDAGGPQRADKEYLIFCNVTSIAPPKVEQLASGAQVRIIADTTGLEMDEMDTIVYGYAVQSEDLKIRWLPDGVDIAQVEQGVEYSFFSCFIDGQTCAHTYSYATAFTPTGEREDTGYQTVLTLESYCANPIYPLVVTYTVLFTTGLESEPVTVTLNPGDIIDTELFYDGSPEKILGLELSVTDENGDAPQYTYEIMAYGSSEKETEQWLSDIAYLFFSEDETTANAELIFTQD